MNDLEQFKAMLDDWGVDYASAVSSGGEVALHVYVGVEPDEQVQQYEFKDGRLTMFAGRKV